MMPDALLHIEDLTLITGGVPVVSHLSFHICAGEIVALTGKSGSGKTTVARAILDMLPAGFILQKGSITWSHDQQHLSLPADQAIWGKLRGTFISYTQQDVFGAFDPIMPIGAQMLLVVNERSLRFIDDPATELRTKMEEVGLHDINRLWSSYPHQLSGGQLQRCQLAISMVIRPALLIADEPTSAIDKINQLELLDVFSMVREKYNMAILCITHEDAVVRYLADREIRLDAVMENHTVPHPRRKEPNPGEISPVLEVLDLEYTHAFGGMMHREGATVGKISFRLFKGRCLGIVGESGSGKSTLAQLLVGLFEPMQGTVIIDGKTVDFRRDRDIRLLRSKVQLVMQDGRGSIHPNLFIRDILEEIVELRTVMEAGFSLSVEESLKEVGLLGSILDRKASQLSGGECLRVSIARALISAPEVLVCDESTSALDGETRDDILELLGSLIKSRGLAIIFISHDERVIRGMADDVMVLANGKIVEQGLANDVIRFPTHPVTRKIFTMHATLEQRGRL